MNEKPDTVVVSPKAEPGTLASEVASSSKAPEGSTLRFYQDEKERNAWFYRWLWRGMTFAILPSIFVAKNLSLVLFFGRYLVVIILILALIRRIRDRKVENSSNSREHDTQSSQNIGMVEKMAALVGGVALGMTVISVIIQIVMVALKK